MFYVCSFIRLKWLILSVMIGNNSKSCEKTGVCKGEMLFDSTGIVIFVFLSWGSCVEYRVWRSCYPKDSHVWRTIRVQHVYARLQRNEADRSRLGVLRAVCRILWLPPGSIRASSLGADPPSASREPQLFPRQFQRPVRECRRSPPGSYWPPGPGNCRWFEVCDGVASFVSYNLKEFKLINLIKNIKSVTSLTSSELLYIFLQ